MKDEMVTSAESVIEVDWANPPKLSDLKADLLGAQPEHNAQMQKIEKWLEKLHVINHKKSNEVNGVKKGSSVTPQLIRKQAEWRYSALSEPFLNNERMFEAYPVTWEDVKAAEQNSLLLNSQFNTVINKVEFIDEYVRTAVDEGTVIVRVGWEFEEKEIEVERPVIELVEDPNVVPLLQEIAAMRDENPTDFELKVPYELKTALEMSEENGVPLSPNVVGTEMVTEMKTLYNRPTLEICRNNNVIVDPTCEGDLNKAGFVIYSFESSIAQLKKDKRYKNLDAINVEGNNPENDPDFSMESRSNFRFSDKSRKKIVVYEYWGYWDINDDGRVVPILASWVGDTMIRLEESPYPFSGLPFVRVAYLPVRKQIHGEPDGALLIDNQEIAGAVTRGMIDLLGKSANGQTGVRRDFLDATNRRKFERGQDYEFNPSSNTHPENAIYMHKYPEIPQSASYMLQMMNAEAESLTGVKAFTGGISGDALGKTATGARGALDAASKREMGILRRLANGLVEIGRKVMAMNAVFLEDKEIIRVTNENFIEIRREDLEGRIDLQLSISTAEEENARAQELTFMLQTVGNNLDFGMVKILLSKIANLRKMPHLAKEIMNYEPQPDPMQQALQEAELEKLRAETAYYQARALEHQTGAELDMAKSGTEKAKARNLDSNTDRNALDFVEQEKGVKHARELERIGEQGRMNIRANAMKHELDMQKETQKTLLQGFVQQSGKNSK